MKIIVKENALTIKDYQEARKTTGWAMLDDSVLEKGLKKDLFSVCIYDDEKLIGIGRVVGDGAVYFYVQDIIVIPEYQGKGIGKKIMQRVEAFLAENTYHNSFVGLMAADGVSEFYLQFGYVRRPDNKPGMSKMVEK